VQVQFNPYMYSSGLSFTNSTWDLDKGSLEILHTFDDDATVNFEYKLTRTAKDKVWGVDYYGTLVITGVDDTGTSFRSTCIVLVKLKFRFHDYMKLIHDKISEMIVPFDVRGEVEKARSQRLTSATPVHNFVQKKFKRLRWCQHCGHAIKSYAFRQHYECTICTMRVHENCLDKVVTTCYSTPPTTS